MEMIKNYLDKRLSDKLVKRLMILPKDQWLEYGHIFNTWGFPVEFYDLLPNWWKGSFPMKRAARIINNVTEVIKSEFGNKEELRYHNVFCGNMYDLEFEYWFNNVRIGCENHEKSFNLYYNRKNKFGNIRFWDDDVYEKLVKHEIITND